MNVLLTYINHTGEDIFSVNTVITGVKRITFTRDYVNDVNYVSLNGKYFPYYEIQILESDDLIRDYIEKGYVVSVADEKAIEKYLIMSDLTNLNDQVFQFNNFEIPF